MRRVIMILGVALVLGVGVTAAVALGAGGNSKDGSSSTGTTAAQPKAWLCHHTGSWKHPYHLIRVSSHAVPAHLRHGDVAPEANNACPTTQPADAKAHGHDHGAGAKADDKSEKDDEAETDDD